MFDVPDDKVNHLSGSFMVIIIIITKSPEDKLKYKNLKANRKFKLSC